MENNTEKSKEIKLYQKNWFIAVMLFVFPPIGIFLIWKLNKSNKVLRILFTIIFVGLFLVQLLFYYAFYDISKESDNPEQTTTTAASVDNSMPANNTSEMVGYIISQAKTDSESSTVETDNEAIAYIEDNIENCFDSNEIMEKMMYYGALLDCKYEDDTALSQIGFQTLKTIKYVYRGIEKETDPVTVDNIAKLKEMLNDYHNNFSNVTKENSSVATTKATTTTTKPTTTTTKSTTTEEYKSTYIINTDSGKFHYSSCRMVKKMNESNKKEYEGTRDELVNQGYSPCGVCNPWYKWIIQ